MPAGSQNSTFCQKSRVHQSLLIIADFQREIGSKNVVLPDYGVIKHVPALDASKENPAALDWLSQDSICGYLPGAPSFRAFCERVGEPQTKRYQYVTLTLSSHTENGAPAMLASD